MRLRPRTDDPASPMPPHLARGPQDGSYAAFRAWIGACTAWGKAHGYAFCDWKAALPAGVRSEFLPTARERIRRLDERNAR